jgi:hypothetical protein
MYKRDTFWGFCPSLGTRSGLKACTLKLNIVKKVNREVRKKEGYNAINETKYKRLKAHFKNQVAANIVNIHGQWLFKDWVSFTAGIIHLMKFCQPLF